MVKDNATTIGSKLAEIELRHFVDRQVQHHIFEKALNSHQQDWQILNLFGPTGVGKSILLKAFKRLATTQTRLFILTDTTELNDAPEKFLEMLQHRLEPLISMNDTSLDSALDAIHRLARHGTKIIFAFDHHNKANAFNRWLRELFLPQLPPQSIIVIASRHPLETWWGGDSTWNRSIEALPLANFTFEEATAYLQAHGIDNTRQIQEAWHLSDGLPLALSIIVSIVEREGTEVIQKLHQRTDLTQKLVQHWRQETSEEGICELVEAASTVRCFNLDLLGQLIQHDIDDALFSKLISASFVQSTRHAWTLHNLVRETIARNFKHRTPSAYNEMRARALLYFGRVATQPGSEQERSAALEELFYMLADGLVRAALYDPQGREGNTLYMESATPADFSDIEEYMAQWREKCATLSGAKIDLYDRDKQSPNPQWIAKEPREPELLNFTEIITKMPGAVKLLRDAQQQLRGLTIIFPINKTTQEYLAQIPVTHSYLAHMDQQQRNTLATTPANTSHWFVRLVDVRDEEDNIARAAIFRELTSLLIRPVAFITSTPLPFYQKLLTQFGFVQTDLPAHTDFGSDRPAPYFTLDLRGEKFVHYIQQMIAAQTGDEALRKLSPALAAMIVDQTKQAVKEEQGQARSELLKPLTKREREVALSAVDGLANCAIAAHLGVTEVTIKKHMSSIFEKLGVRNRRELIKHYWNH